MSIDRNFLIRLHDAGPGWHRVCDMYKVALYRPKGLTLRQMLEDGLISRQVMKNRSGTEWRITESGRQMVYEWARKEMMELNNGGCPHKE